MLAIQPTEDGADVLHPLPGAVHVPGQCKDREGGVAIGRHQVLAPMLVISQGVGDHLRPQGEEMLVEGLHEGPEGGVGGVWGCLSGR